MFALATALSGTLDPISSAAHQIALNLAGVAFMIPLGIGSAGAVRVGHAVGAGDRPRASAAGWTAILLGAVFMILAALVFILVPRQLIGLFSKDADVLAVGSSLLFLAAIFQLFDGIQGVITGTLRGIGDTRTPMVVNLVAHWVLGLPTELRAVLRDRLGRVRIVGRPIAGLDRHRIDFVLRLDAKDQALSRARPSAPHKATAAVINDCHVHFFSPSFFAGLGADPQRISSLGWEFPDTAEGLGARWVSELDKHGVQRAALIASLPGDADAVALAVAHNPDRFVGFFMLDPTRKDAIEYAKRALDEGLRTICLFPAMHGYHLHDQRVADVFDLAASRRGGTTDQVAVFAHCGVLSVGIRKKLGLPSPFDIRYGNPIDLHGVALKHPTVPIIIPHFGAGMLREALMLADCCPNVHLDTSSSNSWIKFTPGPDARAGLQDGSRRRRPRSVDLRNRLVVLPARLERRDSSETEIRARRHRRERGDSGEDLRRELRAAFR